MNTYAIRAIYRFEMARTFRTLMQSIASPVLSTALYFVVFGAAIGARMGAVDGVRYGAFIVPGLVMLSILIFPRLSMFRDRHTAHLGWMSERWLHEFRASQLT